MKRFFAYAGSRFYPIAGLGDLMGHFDTKEEAVSAMLSGMDKENGTDPWGAVFDQQKEVYVCGAGRVDAYDNYYEPDQHRPFPHIFENGLEMIPWSEK